ncbi:LOW QUALITY PROTEIN: dynein axonemal heavy chain 6 [Xyrichtys novacula]|uniref:LOW QUALITY PROTEIN: dynein axonemal heavy chain 6 n=1 Tax=Xyrichtys novacula TaxID=13765 RepID=A0AAV1EU17_XYRNO|nr:LOW QUALITY PROTEIN: dynein axonemal heavy chain 6 [Xyrichtys novacula]
MWRELGVLLDDSIASVSFVASSANVAPEKPRVDRLLRWLPLFKQTLDERMRFQRNWIHLESVFLAPDSERERPVQLELEFLKVDSFWKEMMAKVERIPNALCAAVKPGRLRTLQLNNSLLEEK